MQLYDSIPAVRYLPLPFKKAFEIFKVLSTLSLEGLFLSNFTINNWKTLFERCPMKDISRCSLKPKRQEFRVSRDILLMPTWMNWKRWVLCCRPVLWDMNFVPFLLIHYFSLDKKRGDAGYFSEDQLCAVILDLHFAGTDTTANTLLSGLLYLMKYPHIQGL